jgi:rubrerythrin
MAELAGSQKQNKTLKSFAGESQARKPLCIFSLKWQKMRATNKIAAIFQETANQEKEHAKRFFKFP